MTTFIVDTTQDQNDGSATGGLSLREAVALANANPGADVIRFAAGAGEAFETGGVIRLTRGEIEIADALTIDGSDAGGALTVTGDALGNDELIAGTNATRLGLISNASVGISAEDWLADNAGRIFDIVDAAAMTTLRGLVISGGRTIGEAGGGVRSVAPLEIRDSVVVGNRVEGAGGGGGVAGAAVRLVNATIAGNEIAGIGGGGLHANTVDLSLSTVAGNVTHGIRNWYERQVGIGGVSAASISSEASLIAGNAEGASEEYYNEENPCFIIDNGDWIEQPCYNYFYVESEGPWAWTASMDLELFTVLATNIWDVALPFATDGGAGVPVVALKASADNPALDAADVALAAGVATDSRGAGFARVVDQPGVGGVGATSLDLGSFELQAGPFGPVETYPITIQASGSGAPGGSPRFTVYADGVAIGTGEIANPAATPGAAAFETFAFEAASAPSKLEIVFENDGRAPDGTDINLRIGDVTFGGQTYVPREDSVYVRDTGENLGPQRSMFWNGTLSFEAKTEQVVTVRAAGTGDADVAPEFRVLADGVEIGRGEIAAPAATSAGLVWESFEFRYLDQAPAEAVVVEFLNDQRTPVNGIDVNLFVDNVRFGGETYESEIDGWFEGVRDVPGRDGPREALWWNGRLGFGEGYPPDTPEPGDLLFADDFSGGALSSEWTVVHPNAWVEDGWLHLQDRDGGARNALISTHDSDPAWTDYSVRCTVDFIDIDWLDSFALVLRAKGFDESTNGSFGSGYQFFAYGPTGWPSDRVNTLVLFEFVDPDTTDRIPGVRTELLRVRHDFSTDPFEVVASVEGGRVRAWVDGELLIDQLDPTPRDHGGIALEQIWELHTRYDDVEVVAGSPEDAGWLL